MTTQPTLTSERSSTLLADLRTRPHRRVATSLERYRVPERRARPRRRLLPGVVAVVVDLAVAYSTALYLLDPPTSGVPDLVGFGAVAALWVILLASVQCYSLGPLRRGGVDAWRIVRAATGLVAVLTLTPALVPGVLPHQPDPGRLLLATAVLTGAAMAARWAPELASRRRAAPPARRQTAVVVGHGHQTTRVVAELSSATALGIEVAAVCLPATSRTQLSVPTVRGFDRLLTTVVEHEADIVIVLPCHHFDAPVLRRLGWELEAHGAQLVLAPQLLDVHRSRAQVLTTGNLHLVHVRHARLTGVRRLIKQGWERLAAGLGLLALAPFLILLALAIRLDSPGPAFFRQTRIGKDGKPFVLIKLRTMTTDAETRLGALTPDRTGVDELFKMQADPRVTRLGRVLRRYSVDELPQLINVVRGEMSLVGPRPPLGTEVTNYDRDTMRRLAVHPGLTGLWQVSGRSDLPWDVTVRLDLRYVDNWSLCLDAQILLRTVRAVLGHRGAY
ncbi:hypothetical protein BH11ACT8_BH11ACT8_16180 [soil metagenome]